MSRDDIAGIDAYEDPPTFAEPRRSAHEILGTPTAGQGVPLKNAPSGSPLQLPRGRISPRRTLNLGVSLIDLDRFDEAIGALAEPVG